jgi:multidrug transporter EmrE-like cation transporter
MSIKALLLVLSSVALSAFAQIVLKLGVGSESGRQALADPSLGASYLGLLSNPAVVTGLAAYGLSALVWLRALAELDVSKAYPFVALGIVLTMAGGAAVLGEAVTPLRALGAALVVVGVMLVGLS